MVMPGCPHCRRARELIAAICKQHPELQAVPIREVDETRETAFADSLDYYYVPAFFLGQQRLHEGVPTQAVVETALRTALAAE